MKKSKRFNKGLMFLIVLFVTFTGLFAGTVSGQVTNPSGFPVYEGDVVMFNIGDFPWDFSNSLSVSKAISQAKNFDDFYHVSTDENGDYAFNNVATGDYLVIAFKDGYYETPYMVDGEIYIVSVDADDQEITDINIRLMAFGQGMVSGTITDLENNPVNFAGVTVIDVNNPEMLLPYFSVSDENGNYTIEYLEYGTYKVAVMHEDFFQILAYSEIFEITEVNPHVENINISIDLVNVSVSGTVYKPNGAVAVYQPVMLLTVNENYIISSGMTMTDENGFYQFNYVQNGEYLVVSFIYGHQAFYPGTAIMEEAETITVDSENLENINIAFPSINMFNISGTVLSAETGQPLPNIIVGVDPYVTSLTDENGEYVLMIPQGEYLVVAFCQNGEFLPQFYENADSPYEATIITLTDDIEGINFTLNPTEQPDQFSVSGTITINGQTPDTQVMVIAVSSDEDWESSTSANIYGNYTLPLPSSGNYYIYAHIASNPPTYYPGALNWENSEVVYVNGHINNIDIDIENIINYGLNGTATLSGNVSSTDNNNISNVSIAIRNLQGQLISYSMSNQTGQFNLKNLPNGNVQIIVSKMGYNSIVEEITLQNNNNFDYVLTPRVTNENDVTLPVINGISISNYPNPFNPTTTIAFNLSTNDNISLDIYNIKGQKVKNLYKGYASTGTHKIVWDGRDNNGNEVSSGIYFTKISGQHSSAFNKMILMK